MKIIAIGDLHGKDYWKQINLENYDKVVFMGDYTDSFTISDEVILNNLKEIIHLKNNHPEKVILLLGNHDVQYLHYPNFLCAGFRASMQEDLTKLFKENRNCFQVAWQLEYYLFTHAGITNAWYDDFLTSAHFNTFNSNVSTLAELLNNANTETSHIIHILFKAGKYRGGEGNGSVLTADKIELSNDMISGYKQIVGHTPVRAIETISIDQYTSATFIDILDKQIKFYEIEIVDF